ncbi:MAG: sigma-70 family RNA polymerase sigma factor [Bacteroidales bacterium]|nr:sigma-70 family RNA polymerase sigma factor [Bacteroidales bacterium]
MRELTDFEHFFKENYSKFYYFALRYIDDREVCRDIVSDAFEYAWKFYKNNEIENLKNYIYSFLRNECIDYIRHQVVHQKYAEFYINMMSEEELPEEVDERVALIRKLMDQLTPKTRLILEECYINKKKYKEVAADLEISESAVKKHIVQALKNIRENIVKRDDSRVYNLDINTSTDK